MQPSQTPVYRLDGQAGQDGFLLTRDNALWRQTATVLNDGRWRTARTRVLPGELLHESIIAVGFALLVWVPRLSSLGM